MLNTLGFRLGVMLFGVLIADFSQIMLKKAADRSYDKWWKQYLNPLVICAYAILGLSFICSFLALRGDILPLSMAPLWNAAGYFFVTGFAFLFLKERPNKKKLIGLCILIVGIILFSLQLTPAA